MNVDNTRILVESFSALYCGADRALDDDGTPGFYFECEDGWFNLIFRLSDRLETAARLRGVASGSEDWPRALQVKEKYGTLRFYAMTETDEYAIIIDEAEKESARICEFCGGSVRLRESGRWYKTLCDACALESGFSEMQRRGRS